jgi:transmembrane sensor
MKRSIPDPDAHERASLQDVAARWVVRHDRRLTSVEAAEFETWRSADPRHAAAFEQSLASWHLFRQLGGAVNRAPDPRPTASPRWSWPVAGGLAAAALFIMIVMNKDRPDRHAPLEGPETAVASLVVEPVTRRLSDGSRAQFKENAEIHETFTQAERRVRLLRGEAYFTVEKDATRPFFVEVGNVTVRAIGTAFSVRCEPNAVDVLVTEGTVQVTPPSVMPGSAGSAGQPAIPSMVTAGHRASVMAGGNAPSLSVVVKTVSAQEIARDLAWTRPMLDLAGATLAEVVPLFAERLGRSIEIGDPMLKSVRIGGQFPIDDIDGFVRALETIHDVKSERRSDGSIVLRR